MKRIATPTRPYARKVRVVLAETKIEYVLVDDSPGAPGSAVSGFDPLGYLDLRQRDIAWRIGHPDLARLAERPAQRPSFAATAPPAG